MRLTIIAAVLLFALPALAQTDSFSRGFNDGYRTGFPASGNPMNPYVSGTENGAGARFLDEDDARRRRENDRTAQPEIPDIPLSDR